MYFAIKDCGNLRLKEINGNLSNEFATYNEFKIIKTKVDGEVKVYILIFNEITDAKTLIMAHGGKYQRDKLSISDEVDDREYVLDGEIIRRNVDGEDEIIKMHVSRCKFVEFPLIDELLKVRYDEITQFVSCLEVFKNEYGSYIDLNF